MEAARDLVGAGTFPPRRRSTVRGVVTPAIRQPGRAGNSSFEVHDRFDHSGFRLEKTWEDIGKFIEFRVVSNPGAGIDLAVFDEFDDTAEVPSESVAARHKRELAPVHHRGVWEVEVLLGDADIDDAASMRGKLQRADHRFVIAGG